ncbi:MAG: metallophosphoesterase [Clostridia bacterium]|nr:metallophosphoesterase [Clostridia bacterium]
MKVYAISDLHLSTTAEKPMDVFGGRWVNYMEKICADWTEKVGENDVVLIAGDISWAMKLDDALTDIKTLADLPGKKVMIRGNHDYWWNGISKIRAGLPEGFYCLQNDCLRFPGVVLCGSRGWTVEGSPEFGEQDKKIYLREAERLKLAFFQVEKIRRESDIVICMIHYPPFNARRDNSLFTDIFEKYGVNKVVYGHLHGKDSRADKYLVKNGIEYFLTSCDQVDNKLTLIHEAP